MDGGGVVVEWSGKGIGLVSLSTLYKTKVGAAKVSAGWSTTNILFENTRSMK